MIKGIHAMFYSSAAVELRAFLRDKLQFPFTDVGGGWLIFDMPDAEMGCHPADLEKGAPSGMHAISFYCDDIHRTVSDLTARGVEFAGEVADHGYGFVTTFKMPGDFTVQLYQPKYKRNAPPAARPKAAARPEAKAKSRKKPAAKKAAKRPAKRRR